MTDTRDVDAVIDAALDAYPLAPLPAGFTVRTMARVRAESRRRHTGVAAPPRPGFLDFALPAFAALFTGVLVGTAQLLWATRDPLWWSFHALNVKLALLTWTALTSGLAPLAAPIAVTSAVATGIAVAVWCARPLRGWARPW